LEILNRLPAHALRAFAEIREEEGFTIIRSHFTSYTLDCKSLPGDYNERRLQLISAVSLPYPLYRLEGRYTNLPQLLNSKYKKFIDKDGKVFKYKKTKFVPVKYTRVLRAEQVWNGRYRLVTKLPFPFIVDNPSPCIGYIQVGNSCLLYEQCEELKKPRRVKI
jgi:hypothetical protein